jgi:tetratricopeptide (TPR) repeat protein
MSETPDRLESLFAAAVALANADERAAYLDRACAGDATLRSQVEALLRAHARAGHLLDRPVPGSPERTADYTPAAQAGTVIAGRYKLLEEIGEGGMGTVWVAEQSQPVRRKVALKLIKAGMDSKTVLARFEAERQALAVMDHPHIAKVLDGGVTDTGRPFFVMEYVKGVPITHYCDATRLSVPQRLQLFVQVCQAVQHAHQKGIIHRDLKPSNILVAPYDDRPVPKVIDFGLAKAMHQSLTERTLHTAHETVLGTPLYMSPEQAQLNNLDIDTRSDIYSLGVLLYELLTGTTPLEKKRFKEAAWEEIQRLIREEEPPRPSTRLSSTDTLPTLAASRQTEPARLTRLVRGELDWIVMKALEKDRSRRYETANGFALDVQRYLAGEPVLAAPPSVCYRLGKLACKYRAALTTAAALVVLLVAGVAVSTWQAVRATQAESAARLAEQDAVQAQQAEAARAEGERLARLEAQAQKTNAEQAAAAEKLANEQAQKRLQQIEKANDILGSIFEHLDPKEIARADRPLQAILVEKLDQAVVQLEGESIGEPLVVAAMQLKLGRSLLGLGEADKAIVVLEKARATFRGRLNPDHPQTLTSMSYLAMAYSDAGKLDLAVPLNEETFKLTKAKFGPDHPDTLASMNNLAVAYRDAGKLYLALSLFEEALELRKKARLGPNHPDTLTTMNNLADAYRAAGKLDKALPLYQATLKYHQAWLGPEHPHTLASMSHLAEAYQDAGTLDLAVPLHEETVKLANTKLGPDHPQTLASMNNLAQAYRASGKLALAVSLLEQTVKLAKAKLGPNHPHTLTAMSNLGGAYQDAGKLDLAVSLLEQTVQLTQARFGTTRPDLLICMNNLAAAYLDAGKADLALPLFEQTFKLRKARQGPDHPDTLASMNSLAVAYQHAGKLDVALPLFQETLKLTKAKLGPDHGETLRTMNHLALAYQAAGQLDKALPLHEETFQLTKAKLGPDHPHTLTSMSNLAVAYQVADRLDLAGPLLEQTLRLRKARLGPDHPDTLRSMNSLAEAYRAARKLDLAVPLHEETFKLTKALLGPDHPDTLKTMNSLAETYQDAGKLDLAVPLYEETLKLRKVRLGPDHPDTLWTMNNLATAYRQAKQPDKSIPLFEETLKRAEAKLGRDHLNTLQTVVNLGVTYKEVGRLKEALPLLEEAYRATKKYPKLRWVGTLLLDAYAKAGETAKWCNLFPEHLAAARQALPKDSPQLASLLAEISLGLLQQQKGAEAEPLLRECLAIRQKAMPDHWLIFNTQSMLGGALLQQKKYADAEPLLLAGYAGMTKREAQIPPQGKVRLPEAVQRLVQLYEATGNQDEASKWRKVLEALPRQEKNTSK